MPRSCMEAPARTEYGAVGEWHCKGGYSSLFPAHLSVGTGRFVQTSRYRNAEVIQLAGSSAADTHLAALFQTSLDIGCHITQ